jgi:hypothetical protein
LPPLVNKATGKEIFPSNAVDSAIIMSIADNLESEAQLAMLGNIFPPELAALITDRMTELLKKKREKAEATKAAAQVIVSQAREETKGELNGADRTEDALAVTGDAEFDA